MMVSAHMYRSPTYYGITPWYTPYQYESFVSMEYPHDRMNARSAEIQNEQLIRTNQGTEGAYSRTDVNSGSVVDYQKSHRGSTKILNIASKPIAVSQRRGGSSSDLFVFPGPAKKQEISIPRQSANLCNRAGGLCEDVADYPTDVAKRIIARETYDLYLTRAKPWAIASYADFKDLATVHPEMPSRTNFYKLGDKVNFLTMDTLAKSETLQIHQRLGSDADTMELCKFDLKIYNPLSGIDKDGNTHLIVNDKNNPVQGVRVEICETAERGCRNMIRPENGYYSRCIQKFVFRNMLTFNNDTNTSTFTAIQVPSCCSCVVAPKLT